MLLPFQQAFFFVPTVYLRVFYYSLNNLWSLLCATLSDWSLMEGHWVVRNVEVGLILVHSDIYPTRCNVSQFIYFWIMPYHPSSGAHTTVSTASVTCQTVTATCRCRGVAGSNYSLTSARSCRYSCMCSGWWLEIPPKTCRAVSRNCSTCFRWYLCNISSCWMYIRIYLQCTDPWTLN